MRNSRESARLNRLSAGLGTFGRNSYRTDRDGTGADGAIPGPPFGCGTQWRGGVFAAVIDQDAGHETHNILQPLKASSGAAKAVGGQEIICI